MFLSKVWLIVWAVGTLAYLIWVMRVKRQLKAARKRIQHQFYAIQKKDERLRELASTVAKLQDRHGKDWLKHYEERRKYVEADSTGLTITKYR